MNEPVRRLVDGPVYEFGPNFNLVSVLLPETVAWLDIIKPCHLGCAIFGLAFQDPTSHESRSLHQGAHGADTLPLAAQQACTISL